MTEKTLQYIEFLELNGLDNVAVARRFVESSGFSFTSELESIKEWLLREADANNREAQHALATFYFMGIFGYKSKELAYKFCRQSAESRFGPAVHLLSSFEEAGSNDKATNQSESIRLRREAVELGYGPAARSLALDYLAGKFVPFDAEQGRFYLEKGVELGDVESVFQLSLLLDTSDIDSDKRRSNDLLERAAALNNPSAMRKLAQLYASGGGGYVQNKKRADELSRQADLIEIPYRYDIDFPVTLS
ncbi:tetratricopeptide repeat protein [Dyella sp. GSA-30]|uniref:tetratricopeptide repeat protein n=1 Tax=Dyella sp. GSA-30 TaxID=2994496 RepID=UPI0024900017|nr:tetratricopeptide repeat protein [Dyella sp. GSA-30]BDU22203.1 hypothetical protein DYGSA30_36600 [Dyella sp. GSA-30]